jgi:hypothetical protein
MLIVPGDDDSRSAGSFKNPILSDEQFAEIMKRAAAKTLRCQIIRRRKTAQAQRHGWSNTPFCEGYRFGQVGISRDMPWRLLIAVTQPRLKCSP